MSIEKNVKSDMLDNLMDDQDKPKPAYNSTYTPRRVTSRDFDFDEGDDVDFSRPSYSHGRSNYGSSNHSAVRRSSVFKGASSHAATTKYAGDHAAVAQVKRGLEAGLNSGPSHYYMPAFAQGQVTAGLVKILGEVFDEVGLCWGEQGVRNAYTLINDMLATNMFYRTASGGYKELDFGDGIDTETGEVLGDDDYLAEERKAIKEE